VKALVVERSVARFAAARVASEWRSGAAGRAGPLQLADVERPELPGPGWVRLRPRLSGICGSDLATVDGRSSRWFEPIVSFPFVPGHEVVADADSGERVILQPVLGCEARGINPRCPACAAGEARRCRHLAGGHVRPGLQTGYCADTGGGWSLELVAHRSQVHPIPDDFSDEAAVMVEPTACAVHGALVPAPGDELTVAVIGAGTLGLCTVAALSRFRPDMTTTIVAAKHPHQRRLATELGATAVVEAGELRRAVRRRTGSWMFDTGQLTGGADVTYDCVGSSASLAEALAVTRPGGTVVLLGMPGEVSVDLAPLWQREVALVGAYTYGPEANAGERHSFDLAFELVDAFALGRLVSVTYGLDRFADAIAHAGAAGRRGAVKVAFDLRGEKRR
jgi:threonine dehydrogenase-like Zn-dependent dehydrogenase